MSKWIVAAAAMVAFLAAAASAMETEYLIASWENTMDHFGTGTSFDAAYFTTTEGVTHGTYALAMDLKPNWNMGLVSGGYPDWGWEAFFPELAGAIKLRLDVTSSSAMFSPFAAQGLQIALFMQGQSGSMPAFGSTYAYKTVSVVSAAGTITETIEWDLTRDDMGNPVMPLPAYSAATGGWFDMRFHFNVTGGAADPGVVIMDNLRSVVYRSDPCMGDFNGDGSTDQADYTVWADHYGESDRGVFYMGTSNADGIIDQADYATWADNFGSTYPMPEPATLAMLAIGASALLRRRR